MQLARWAAVCELQADLWVVGASGTRPRNATLCTGKGLGTCGTISHLGWEGSWGHPDFVCWACEGLKAQEFLSTRSPIRSSSLSCYFVVAPSLNYFKDWDIWDCAMGVKGPCLSVQVWGCRESSRATVGSLQLPALKGLQVWLPDWHMDGWTEKFP